MGPHWAFASRKYLLKSYSHKLKQQNELVVLLKNMLRKKLKVFGNLALFFFHVFLFVLFVDFELFFTNRITCIRSHFNI